MQESEYPLVSICMPVYNGARFLPYTIDNILAQLNFTYSSLFFQLPPKQKEVLIAICKEGKAREITSSKFLKTYKLTASSVQLAIKRLLVKYFLTNELCVYSIYDKFFDIWLKKQIS